MRTLPRILLAVAFVCVLQGCGKAAPANPLEQMIGGAKAWLWLPPGEPTPLGPALTLLCSPGSDPRFWDPLAGLAAREGYHVLVCPAPGRTSPLLQVYAAQLNAANEEWNKRKLPAERRALLGDGPAALAAALRLTGQPGAPQALVAISPDIDGIADTPEDAERALKGLPQLLVVCENDAVGARTAHALKEASGDYCELQLYACGVRGADLLAAAPNVAAQVVAWLKPITGGGIGQTTP